METQTDESLRGSHLPSDTTKSKGTLDEIVVRLDKAYTKGWITHLPDINELLKGKDLDTRQNRAKGYSVYLEALSLKNDAATKYKLADIHRAIQGFAIDKPKLSSYNKFVAFISQGPGSTSSELLDYMSNKPRGTGNSKIGEGLKALIYAFYADSRKLNFNRIAELASHAVREEVKHGGIDSAIAKWQLPDTSKVRQQLAASADYISGSTVKKLITLEVRNIYCRARYGAKEFRQAQVTPIFRKRAQHPLDRVEFDSTVFSFVFYDIETKKFSIRLNTCLIVDSYSGRIIGYAFGKTESASLVLSALENTFTSVGYLPAEIFTDRFPGHNNEEIKYFFKQIKSLGCHFDIERTGNARAKGLVEVTVNNLCELAKEHKHFSGKNITTTSKDSRKSVEVLVKLTRADQAVTLESVKGQIIELIALYNSRKPAGQQESRHNKFFTSGTFQNAIPLTLENRVWLFHKVLIKKVEQGAIIFRKGIQRFIYPIVDPINRLRLNGGTVKVRYNEADFEAMNDIWLFDVDTDELICTCTQQVSPYVARVNQTDKDIEIYKNNKSDKKNFREIIKGKELEVDPLSIEVSNYMISSKVEQTNLEELYLLRSMLSDQHDAKSETLVCKDDDGKLFAIVPDPHNRNKVNEEPSLDRLSGYEDDDIIGEPELDRLTIGMQDDFDNVNDEPEPIMIVNKKG